MPNYVLGTPIDAAAAAEAGGLSSLNNSSRLDLALRGPISEARPQASKRQEVLDERGRPLRFHGAFTGGFSAGYFNTVGSAEGWTPSSFVSSRTNKAESTTSKSTISNGIQAFDALKPFMDAEDEESMGALLVARSSYKNNAEIVLGGGGGGGGGGGEKKRSREESNGVSYLDLVVKDSGDNSIGIKLLELCGWRRGQRVGLAFALRRAKRGLGLGGGLGDGVFAPKTEEEALARLECIDSEKKLERQQEIELDALWNNATSRPPNAKFGVSFDPHSVRKRQSATEQIRNASSSAFLLGNDEAGGTSINVDRARLKMSSTALLGMHPTIGGAGGNSIVNTLGSAALRQGTEGGGSLPRGSTTSVKRGAPQQPLYTSRTNSGLLSFDLDDDGDDDASAYRQPSLLEYDIQSTSGIATGYSGSSSNQEKISQHESHLLASSGFPASSSLRIADRNHGGESILLKNKNINLCADGRPPLPGFCLATRQDSNVFAFARSHKPPPPPSGWVPQHQFFEKEDTQSMSLYKRFGYNVNSAQHGSDTTSAEESATRADPVVQRPVHNSLPEQSTNTFFDKFSKGNSASTEKVSSEDKSAILPAVQFLSKIPKVGSTNKRSTSTFLPSKLLLKRFNVADPFMASDRLLLSNPAVAASAAGSSSTTSSTITSDHLARIQSSQASHQDVSKSSSSQQNASTFPPTTTTTSTTTSLQQLSSSLPGQRPPPDISSATAAVRKIAATLAPINYRPPQSLFETIFGASFTI